MQKVVPGVSITGKPEQTSPSPWLYNIVYNLQLDYTDYILGTLWGQLHHLL
jgi:hypothetical protein